MDSFLGRNKVDPGSILDNLETWILITDLDGIVLCMNRSAERNRSLTDPPVRVGASVFESIAPERRERTMHKIRRLTETREPFTMHVAKVIDGREVNYDIKYSTLPDVIDRQLRIMIEVNDVTQYGFYERKITASALDLSTLIESANAVIIGIDSQGYVTDWNEKSALLTGYSKSEVFAKSFVELLVNQEDHAHFRQGIQDVLNEGHGDNYELRIKSKSGESLVFLINAAPRRNLLRQVIGVLLIGQDITELVDYRVSLEKKIAERTVALQESLRKEKELVEVKNRFVSIASHEFRTPLLSIQFASDFIKKNIRKVLPGDIVASLEKVDNQVKLMISLLDDVLLYGKGEAGKIRLMVSRIDLKTFVNRIVEEIGHATRNSHNIVVTFDLLSDEIEMDEKLLRSIISNLLTNAIKYSPERKSVRLGIRRSASHIIIEVIDQGIGIAEGDIERIFEPFQRTKIESSIKGTGLGLNIVKKSVELLNGSIQVESKLGIGTTFTVVIPEPIHK